MRMMVNRTLPAIVRAHRPPPVMVCKKCLKRAANGRAIKHALKSELKSLSRTRGEKRSRVVMTGCFGLCPKRAVTAASGTTLARGEYLLLADEGQAAEAASRLTARET
jgi:predicted metal-binding protein